MNEMRIRLATFGFFNLDFITADRFTEVIIAGKRTFLHEYYILENGAKSVIFYSCLNIIFGDTYVYAAG